jgi:AcrR family transcriptional regulator
VSTVPQETSPRQRILDVTLALMAQRGVAGTSMRDLASAAGLNVASLYHYFPSKHDLLLAVLKERGMLEELGAPSVPAEHLGTNRTLVELLDDILQSMLEVEDFIRLMLGEVMRGDPTVQQVGSELFSTTQEALEQWLETARADLRPGSDVPALARVLTSVLIGLFFEHVAGVLGEEDPATAFHRRSVEIAAAIGGPDPASVVPPGAGPG